MTRGRWVAGSLVVAISGLIALVLVAWFVPSGPKVSSSYGASFDYGYVGNRYGFFQAVTVHESFVPVRAQVAVTGHGCHGDLRLLTWVPGSSLSGVSQGPLPGRSAIGQRITPANNRRLTVVLTPAERGRCAAMSLTITTHSWGRDRSTTVPLDFYVNATHAAGTDSRAEGFPIGK